MSDVATSEPSPTPERSWEILPLAHSSWRICDREREHSDASGLVAYVEKTDYGTLEVLWLRSPCPSRSSYRDFDELLDALAAAVEAPVGDRSAPPSAIPHFPPPRG